MIYNDIVSVLYVHTRAVIINVSTRLCTTLAILSVKKRTNLPLLVVDCPYNGKSDFEALKQLSIEYDFDLIQLPLQKHGYTLDYIFRNINAENLLLVDSDLEVLDGSIVKEMLRFSEYKKFFGSGITHGPCKLFLDKFFCAQTNELGLYAERMWIPFTLLNVAKVREALEAGRSFADKIVYNVLPWNQCLSKYLYKYFPKLCNCWVMRRFKVGYGHNTSNIIYYDTGAEIYEYLKDIRYLSFSCMRYEQFTHENYVKHYEGITRKILFRDEDMTAADLSQEETYIIKRLYDEYNYVYR